ncbi:uncharacterized protein LOC134488340 [Candoia aspera]|uniref:uncharacterized protein LOC134488340 n=1 Tax=Candoia aspera TaxID=51853 RepID=UPI002FD85C51
MGGKVVPLLLSAEGKPGKTCTFCLGIATVIFLFCFVIFLILYMQERHEKVTVHQTLERKSRERDAMWIQLLSSNQTLVETERLLEMKKKENEDLSSTLVITNQTLGKKIQLLQETEQKKARLQEQLGIAEHNLTTIQGHWNSCQAELHIMQENITSFAATITQQAAEEQKLKDIMEQLLEQLSSKTRQLTDAKREVQLERGNFDRYKQEVAKQAQENHIPCGKGILSDFNMAFFPIILSELLFFL